MTHLVIDLEIPKDPHLPEWASNLLFILNGATAIITCFNVLYLRYKAPRIENRGWNSLTRRSVVSIGGPEEFRSLHTYSYRKAIQKYFYLIAVIPLFVSITGHFGARFPHESIWIFPGMNIVIAIAYLLFIRMMVISCDGWYKVRAILVDKPDECKSYIPFYQKCVKQLCCKCFLRKNAYIGLKQRMMLCLLIFLKPVINYSTAVYEYDQSSFTNNIYMQYMFKLLAIATTVIPLKSMDSFHCALLPYSRLRRSTIKRAFVSFLGPVCQFQQTALGIAFIMFHFDEFAKTIDAKYKWTVAYGILLCVEMLIFSLITIYPFNPQDLRLWEYSEGFLRAKDTIELRQLRVSDVDKNNLVDFV
eukprot:475787_1